MKSVLYHFCAPRWYCTSSDVPFHHPQSVSKWRGPYLYLGSKNRRSGSPVNTASVTTGHQPHNKGVHASIRSQRRARLLPLAPSKHHAVTSRSVVRYRIYVGKCIAQLCTQCYAVSVLNCGATIDLSGPSLPKPSLPKRPVFSFPRALLKQPS
jgi:hypothetical protein